MALFNNNMFSGGGILEGLFPEMEMGKGNRGGFLPQDLESLLAQEARDRAAQAFRLRSRVSKIDPSLLPDYQPPNKDLENFLNPPPPQGWVVQPSQPAPMPQSQPMATPQWGAGATPFQFGGLNGMGGLGGNAPMAPPQPARNLAPNGLDRNMTSLPPEYAAMDATRNQIAGYTPSPSIIDQIPANARPAGPAQRPMAPVPQEQDIGFGDRLNSAFQGFTNAKSPMQAFGNLIGGLTTGQRTDPAGIAQQNVRQAYQGFQQLFLSRGLPPAQANSLAMIAATNPKVAEEILKSPTTMEGAMVNPYVGQGGGNQTKTYLDFIRQKNAAEKAGTTEGEKVATAQLDLPSAVAQANEQLRLLDELKKHPGRSQLGWHDVLGSAPLVPSTKGYDAQVILDQIKGGAFLEAYKTLRGGGQITEVEGKKATAAIARMDRAQSKAEFDKALDDYRVIIQLGIDRASQMAGQPAPGGFQGNTGWTEIKPGIRIRKAQ